jgi:hypothetical protein
MVLSRVSAIERCPRGPIDSAFSNSGDEPGLPASSAVAWEAAVYYLLAFVSRSLNQTLLLSITAQPRLRLIGMFVSQNLLPF